VCVPLDAAVTACNARPKDGTGGVRVPEGGDRLEKTVQRFKQLKKEKKGGVCVRRELY